MHKAPVFPKLKPFQMEALLSLKNREHTILIASTGSGKTLVMQKYLHEFKRSTRALVVTPLSALGRQLGHDFSNLELNLKLGLGRQSESPPSGSGIWIGSPEKVFGSAHAKLREWRPNLLIVDEAHCVWEWGNYFRPEFAKLPQLVKAFSISKSFWCTATLPIPARKKIAEALPSEPNHLGRFALPAQLKIERHSVPSHQKLEHLRNLLTRYPHESGMVFVSTRASAERLRRYLSAWGYRAIFYHAGMSTEERIALEVRLSQENGDAPIWIVATSAFGMGMNYPFLKVCVLFEPSLTLLSLAQSLGRVGRSEAPAYAHVFWHENDFLSMKAIASRHADHESRVDAVKTWCMTADCPREHLENYFNSSRFSGTFDG